MTDFQLGTQTILQGATNLMSDHESDITPYTMETLEMQENMGIVTKVYPDACLRWVGQSQNGCAIFVIARRNTTITPDFHNYVSRYAPNPYLAWENAASIIMENVANVLSS